MLDNNYGQRDNKVLGVSLALMSGVILMSQSNILLTVCISHHAYIQTGR